MKKTQNKKGQVDFILFISIMALVSIGVVMVYSASSYISFFTKDYKYDSMFFLKKQLRWAILGTICMIITMRIDYHKVKKITGMGAIITLILLVVVLFSKEINGAQRWINFGFATIQPSEIAKYMIVLILGKSIERRGRKIKEFWMGTVYYLFIAGIYAGLILIEPNLSIASVVIFVTLIILFTSGANIWHIGVFGLLGGIAGGILIVTSTYRLPRLMSFLDPWKDPLKTGYQLIQSLLALGSGGIFGVGLGMSRQKCFYIPEPHNDFIFSIIGEELGLIGCVFIIALYLVFIWRGIRTALRAKDVYGTILATGITSVVAVQAIINIAVVSGSMPVTGVPLPFISYGGSSLVFNLIAMGILLNITRQNEK